jgi:hypothetical protein
MTGKSEARLELRCEEDVDDLMVCSLRRVAPARTSEKSDPLAAARLQLRKAGFTELKVSEERETTAQITDGGGGDES